jgi:hypothetical protein
LVCTSAWRADKAPFKAPLAEGAERLSDLAADIVPVLDNCATVDVVELPICGLAGRTRDISMHAIPCCGGKVCVRQGGRE